jgi:SlyX protein
LTPRHLKWPRTSQQHLLQLGFEARPTGRRRTPRTPAGIALQFARTRRSSPTDLARSGRIPEQVYPCGQCVHAAMTELSRLDQIEIKLAHLERALVELNDVVIRQQREIELLTARNRQLKQQLESLESGGGGSADAFEKPPHY